MKRILVVGQGLAGSILALELMKQGAQVTVADDPLGTSSTKVAAGVIRPVTGRHIAKTPKADELIPAAIECYRSVERNTNTSFFVERDILQLFSSPSSYNEWYSKASSPGLDMYVGDFIQSSGIHPSIRGDFGGVVLKKCGYLITTTFLSAAKQIIAEHGHLSEHQVRFSELIFSTGGVEWHGSFFDAVVFSTGSAQTSDPLFGFLPFRPVKGEILDFTSVDLDDKYIVNNGNFFVPMGNGHFRAGATYVWNYSNDQPTSEGRLQIEKWIHETINVPYTVTVHLAGVRPAVMDRRPLLGFHPDYPQVAIFNGMGSKGVLLAPYYAVQMAKMLLENVSPDPDVDIKRFEKYFQGEQ